MWTTFVVQPMINLLLWIYSLVGNFGLAIIIFTVLIRLILYPLMRQQTKSAEAMQKLQQDPRWKEIQRKYKNDRERLAQEQMKLYQELGVNPFASCLPMLIQIPVIFGLYQAIILALGNTPAQLLELTALIYPGWDAAKLLPIDSHFLWMDLSRPERLTIPGLNFGIPVMALLVAYTGYIQAKVASSVSPTSGSDQAQSMNTMMSYYMPLMLGYFAMTFASGLALYFLTSNLVSIAQYALMGKLSWRDLIPFGGGKK
ncbi:MAG: YidC/Oxa1 family membrane protein insertase [Chloroflexi bacterium]|nr:YidC/Oxa1 family membrane protein insertase [Chloroflexota bacterium]